ncbi:MAG: hypothetical protein J3R72DRAFT_445609, partial [Linnemannia gamsii]
HVDPSVTASYSVATPLQDTTSETTRTAEPILTFESPIDATYNTSTTPDQLQKEQYLTALTKALSALQESINTGVLEDKGDNPVDIKNKVRTKVPGQPNNSKKESATSASTTTEPVHGSEATTTTAVEVMSLSLNSTTAESSSAMDVDPSPSTELANSTPKEVLDLEDQYKPKGGIYGNDDEDETTKDEVDLVMEADPGEIDGACLELPKEQDISVTPAAALSQTKKRNELPIELSVEDAATTKKSRGSDS